MHMHLIYLWSRCEKANNVNINVNRPNMQVILSRILNLALLVKKEGRKRAQRGKKKLAQK